MSVNYRVTSGGERTVTDRRDLSVAEVILLGLAEELGCSAMLYDWCDHMCEWWCRDGGVTLYATVQVIGAELIVNFRRMSPCRPLTVVFDLNDPELLVRLRCCIGVG